MKNIKIFNKYRDKKGIIVVPYLYDGEYYICSYKTTTKKLKKEDIFPFEEEIVVPEFIESNKEPILTDEKELHKANEESKDTYNDEEFM